MRFFRLADESTEIIDLKRKNFDASFIDCHSHFAAVANSFLQLSLKNCTNIEEIQNQLLKFKMKIKYHQVIGL